MRLWKQLLSLVIAFVAALGGWWVVQPEPRTVTGVAQVTEGDSLRVNGVEIRLKGVDAPELRQTCERAERIYRCGEEVRGLLANRVAGRPLVCRVEGRDRYRRTLATCFLGDENLSAWLVELGWAVGYRDYEREEARARARSSGLWAGTFERPIDWRRENTARSS
jgi:endonuclease YncB( thermonuclease family)